MEQAPDKYEKLFIAIKQNNPQLFCCYCECVLTSDNPATREHVRPRSKGGNGKNINFKNVHPACRACNQEKKNMYLNEYLGYLHGQFGQQDLDTLNIKIKNVKKLMRK